MASVKIKKDDDWKQYSNFDAQPQFKEWYNDTRVDVAPYLNLTTDTELTATKIAEALNQQIYTNPHLYFIHKAVAQLAKLKRIYIKNINYSPTKYIDHHISYFNDSIYELTFDVEEPQYITTISLNVDEQAFTFGKALIDKDCGLLYSKKNLDEETKMIIRWGYVLWKAYSNATNPGISGNYLTGTDFSITKDITIYHVERKVKIDDPMRYTYHF